MRLGAERLTRLGLKSSTALVERMHLTLRQALAPLVRKTFSFCKDREQMGRRVAPSFTPSTTSPGGT